MNGHAKHEKQEDKEEEDVKMEEEEEEKEKERSPLIELLDSRFLLTLPDSLVPALERQIVRNKVQELVTKHKMAALYPSLCAELKWPVDQAFLDKLKADASAEKDRLQARIAKAKEEAGDTEVRDALFALAEFLAHSGERDAAYAAYKDALAQSVGIGSRMDVLFCCMRVGFLHNDLHGVKQYIEQAKALIATGADWERRNLLKIYEAVYTIQTRDFKKAAALLLDSIATFTCYEMSSYNTFIFYAVITSIFAVSRTKLKEKVIASPEILSVYRDIPNLETLLQSFYKCRYAQFFAALNALTPSLQRDPFLAPHLTHILREIRVVTYQQYLQSYRSVKLESMAESMGFSTALLDQELSRFISAGRLNCKIDKVKGVVETNRPDTKNHQYQEIIKHGDLLLSRLQKLTKSVSG